MAAPIEQQVNGVDGMLYMSSQMGNDGSYSLTVTFDVGTDLNTALVMVQNRVTQAMPQLPTPVQNQGITIRKRTPDILMVVNFFSPHGRYDDLYLSNYATINVRDEILRLDGVSDVNLFGQRDYSIRVWLDPQKMAGYGISAGDVARAIASENLDSPAGQLGQPPLASGQSFRNSRRHAGPALHAGAVRRHRRQGRSGPSASAFGRHRGAARQPRRCRRREPPIRFKAASRRLPRRESPHGTCRLADQRQCGRRRTHDR